MLHTTDQSPVPGYSKGSWGLSVLLRVSGIFTGTTTSPRSSLFAECCVFVKQSHGPFHCASRHCPEGPLLPKLRGHVAEFLNEVSPARLGMFVPSHLCRFWYGLPFSIGCFFLAAWTHGLAGANPRSARTFRYVRGIAISPFHCPSATHPLGPLRQVQEC